MKRRDFLKKVGIAGVLMPVAPAIVRAESLMPVVPYVNGGSIYFNGTEHYLKADVFSACRPTTILIYHKKHNHAEREVVFQCLRGDVYERN